jgi:hypothetical protein
MLERVVGIRIKTTVHPKKLVNPKFWTRRAARKTSHAIFANVVMS